MLYLRTCSRYSPVAGPIPSTSFLFPCDTAPAQATSTYENYVPFRFTVPHFSPFFSSIASAARRLHPRCGVVDVTANFFLLRAGVVVPFFSPCICPSLSLLVKFSLHARTLSHEPVLASVPSTSSFVTFRIRFSSSFKISLK